MNKNEKIMILIWRLLFILQNQIGCNKATNMENVSNWKMNKKKFKKIQAELN